MENMNTVIVGGGFAGVKAALELSKKQLGKITLISNQPDFIHHATIYSTLAGHDKSETAIPLEDIFANHHDVKVIIDPLLSVDPDRRLAVCRNRSYHYDKLLLALGSTSDFFDVNGASRHSFAVKNLNDIEAFRQHLKTEIQADKHLDKNYIIVGGGATGVEIAGSLSEYLQDLAFQYLPKRTKINITIVESKSRLLAHHSRAASHAVTKRLESLGVTVHTSTQVTKIDADYVFMNGKKVPSHTVFWTSGVSNNPFYAESKTYFKLAENGKVIVNPYLEAYKNIYILGDNADVAQAGTAKAAIHMAKFIAQHLLKTVTDRHLSAYRPKVSSISIPVGRNWAYYESKGVYIDGMLGYWLRRRQELGSYKQILSPNAAQSAWRSHNRKSKL